MSPRRKKIEEISSKRANERTILSNRWLKRKRGRPEVGLSPENEAARTPNRVEDEYIDTARLIRNSL